MRAEKDHWERLYSEEAKKVGCPLALRSMHSGGAKR